MDNRKIDRLRRMGIDVYVPRGAPGEDPSPAEDAPAEQPPGVPNAAAGDDQTAASWQMLEQEVSVCVKCELSRTRTQTVFGVGNPDAQWMLIGEAPGMEEDRRGEPFVGRAGKLLDKMLAAIGFDRSTVYIANILKCRPPENRNPRPGEVACCIGYLHRQITHIKPQLILALGGVAASNLLRVETPVGRLRGRQHRLPGTDIPLVVTYHPAYLLRAPQQKRAAWDDLQFACRIVGKELP